MIDAVAEAGGVMVAETLRAPEADSKADGEPVPVSAGVALAVNDADAVAVWLVPIDRDRDVVKVSCAG